MRNYGRGVLLILLLTEVAPAQTLKLPDKVTGQPGTFIKVPATTDGSQVRWLALDPGLACFPVELLKDSKTAVVVATVAGSYRLMAYSCLKDVPTDPTICLVIVGDVPPVPPGPGPVPPGPGPVPPGPAPIPGEGLKVLMIYDDATLGSLPKEQLTVLTSEDVRGYLNGHCVKGPDGKTPEWRIWSAAVTTGNETKTWQDAFNRPRKSLPWIIISNPQKGGGFEGPLPGNTADTLSLLAKYGG